MLKVLAPEHSSQRDADRLRNEFDVGRMLKGLAVVEPLAFFAFQGLPALELEDFAGDSLERFAGKPLPIDVFLSIAERVASAVATIHGRGLIHKDLKPANIIFNDHTGEIKIADFCIASEMAREQAAVRPARLIEGSLPYVSPEQTGRMNRGIDSRSDLYSLGVTFYQLVTGRLPFQSSDPVGWVYCHLACKALPPRSILPSIPDAVSEIILKLLEKVPDDRYQSATGLAYDLAKCREQWRETGTIVSFPLGQRDVSNRFLIPQKSTAEPSNAPSCSTPSSGSWSPANPSSSWSPGYSGIGKSSVVRQLQQPIVAKRGFFVTGKFEQYKRDVPYFTIVQAFRELMLDILAESAESIADWRRHILEALGPRSQLIVDLIPQVGLVIGAQPPVPELSLSEAENRLRRVVREFLGVFATDAHPLTLFLDDLQWADPASLKLLVDLMTHPSVRHLLVIGAYRDNEVGPSHPLTRALDEVRAQGADVETLELGPLRDTDLGELVADIVRCSAEEAAPIARLLGEKTGGNPYFAIQFLTAFHRKGLIYFDSGSCRWRWDLALIRAQQSAENVAELMVNKVRSLPIETQKALELAACLGATIEAHALGVVLERDPEEALRAAFEQDLLLQTNGAFRFPHDRVQETAYSLIPEKERPGVHLHIGRLLLQHTAPADLEEKIFDLVGQFNRGVSLITAGSERERVAELNLMAGDRAHRSPRMRLR